MRCGLVVMIALAAACARSTAPQVVTTASATTVDELLAARPLAPDVNIRADEIARIAGASVHLVQVRTGEMPHRHVSHDLVVHVVRGRGVFTLDGHRRAMAAGDVAVIPRGAVHWFTNGGSDVAVTIVTFTPPLDAPDTVPVDVDSRPGAR
jgi:quercetin dioxygenase-like cupin family protein